MRLIGILMVLLSFNAVGQPLYLFGGIDTTLKEPDDTIITEVDTTLGTPIEAFGAISFYRKFLNNLTFTPQVDNSTLVTYTGIGDPFNADYVGKEFVEIERNHLNTGVYPPANTVNGNYWPGIRSCRYSVVTSVYDGKNLYVNFKYNGGDTANPQIKTLQSGYFFYDNKAAFAASMLASDTIIKLKTDSVYVIKGGFNSMLTKNVMYYAPIGKASIKVSIEDPFLTGYRVFSKTYGTSNSYSNTFGSIIFWHAPLNQNYNFELRNISLLAPHNIMESVDMGNVVASWVTASTIGINSLEYLGGNRTVQNVDTDAEYTAESGANGNYVNFALFSGNGGGKLVGTDVAIEDMQKWNIFNTNYSAREPLGIRGGQRSGNLLTVNGSTVSTNGRGRRGEVDAEISIGQDITGRRNIITIVSDTTSWERLMNQYNWGDQGNNYNIYLNETRWEYYDVPDGLGNTWRLYWANTGCFAGQYAGTGNTFFRNAFPIITPKKLRVNEDIPYVGQTITIDGVKNKKINDTTFQIEDIGLQAIRSYPGLLLRFWVDTPKCLANPGGFVGSRAYEHPWCFDRTTNNWPILPNDTSKVFFSLCDSVETGGIKYGLVARRRHSRTTEVPSMVKSYWVYTTSSPIAASNPVFTVTTSRTEFLLTGTHQATLRSYPMGSYGNITYIDKSLNTVFRNSSFNGFWRATENDGINKFDATGPLRIHNRWKIFENVIWTGAGYQEMFGSGLYYRNVKEGYDGKNGPWRVYISGGNIVPPTQTPTNDPVVTD